MTQALFVQTVVSALSVGLGCGTCCMPQTGTFLTSYIISHGRGGRAFIQFFLGKCTAIILLCLISSALGVQLISGNGLIGTIDIYIVFQSALIILGLIMILRWMRKSGASNAECGNCSGCDSNKAVRRSADHQSGVYLYLIGFSCGITPCAPMFLIMGQAVLLPWAASIALGATFGLASSLSPVLLLVLLSGVLSSKMREQIPRWIKWFQLGCYVVLIGMSIISIISHCI